MNFGIAFAGGGLKGIAYIGVIKAFNELGINAQYISGTSSGSIFGMFYALGLSVENMEEIILGNYKQLIKVKKAPTIKALITYLTTGKTRIEGLIDGENIEKLISKMKDKDIIKINNMNEIEKNLYLVKGSYIWQRVMRKKQKLLNL